LRQKRTHLLPTQKRACARRYLATYPLRAPAPSRAVFSPSFLALPIFLRSPSSLPLSLALFLSLYYYAFCDLFVSASRPIFDFFSPSLSLSLSAPAYLFFSRPSSSPSSLTTQFLRGVVGLARHALPHTRIRRCTLPRANSSWTREGERERERERGEKGQGRRAREITRDGALHLHTRADVLSTSSALSKSGAPPLNRSH